MLQAMIMLELCRYDIDTRPTPMGAIISWSAATRFPSAFRETLFVPLTARSGNRASRKAFHLPMKGPIR